MSIVEPKLVWRLVTTTLIGAALFALPACGGGKGFSPVGEQDDAGPIIAPSTTATVTVIPPGPCATGERQACKYNLPTHAGIVSCFHGIEICTDGVWGPCIDGTLDGGADAAPAN